ncbi:SRPBCC family protein [Piscinibacter terrae]|nr:SRPBCC family protein [Albitalea terrae]
MSTVLMEKPAATDRIERHIVIQAPRDRVWRALSNAEEFGQWFGTDLKGQTFAPGQRVRGLVSGCGHDNVWFDAVVDRIEPQNLFSYRWHPAPIDPAVDYDQEEPTLVTFTLKDAPGQGTLLTVVESGFDKVPPQRRLEAFRMNDGGWAAQLKNIARHASQ